MNLEISPGQVVWPRVMLVFGLSMCFAPANVAAYLYIPPSLRGAAVGLLSLLRNEGGSVGTSMAQTIQERRDQFHILRIGELLDSFNANVVSFLHQARAIFLQQTGDPSAAQQLALADARELAAAAGIVTCLFRCLFVVGRGDAGAATRGAADEAFGGRERRPHRCGIASARAHSVTAHYAKVCWKVCSRRQMEKSTFSPDKDVTLHGWGVFV